VSDGRAGSFGEFFTPEPGHDEGPGRMVSHAKTAYKLSGQLPEFALNAQQPEMLGQPPGKIVIADDESEFHISLGGTVRGFRARCERC